MRLPALSLPLAALRLLCAVVLASVALPHLAFDQQRMAQAAQAAGPRAVASLPALQQLLASGAGVADAQRLAAVNDFFNQRVAFRDDIDVWGVHDHWASPLEVLAKGAGDCEDYTIGKYFALVAMGMPVTRLRLVYVRASLPAAAAAPPVPHMVLAYYAEPGAEPLILDNLVPQIRRAGQRLDLLPLFSFNSEGLWEGTGSASVGDPSARLSPWRQVLEKTRREGFL